MKIVILIKLLLNLIIIFNTNTVFGQYTNNNDLLNTELQAILANIQNNIQRYLPKTVVQNVNSIFASGGLNITSVIKNSYACTKTLTPTSTTTRTTIKTNIKTTTKTITSTTNSSK